MGRSVDRLVLLSLLAGALYLFFVGAMGSIPLAAASAFFAMAIIKKLSEKLPADRLRRRRRARTAAKAELEKLALSIPREAVERISRALEHAYPGQLENAALAPALRHPSGGKFTAADVSTQWKRHRGAERLVIVSLSKADDGAFSLAARLKAPDTRLIDGEQLTALLAACPQETEAAETCPGFHGRIGRPALVARAASRARVGKCVCTGALMFFIFFATGRAVYLAGSLILLFIAGVGLRGRARPRELFD